MSTQQKSEPWTSRDVFNLVVVAMVVGLIGLVLWNILIVAAKCLVVCGCIWVVCQFGSAAGRQRKKEESK